MVLEKSAGAIVFRQEGEESKLSSSPTELPKEAKVRKRVKSSFDFAGTQEGNEIYYLLLHYPTSSGTQATAKGGKEDLSSLTEVKKEYWGFPKGHIERGEKIEETAKREVEEETGLKDIKLINGFKEQDKYFFTRDGRKFLKTVVYLLAETKTKEIKISWEHLGFRWLSYGETLKQLTFKNAKEILKKANKFLSRESV